MIALLAMFVAAQAQAVPTAPPAPPPSSNGSQARAQANLASYVTNDDYPPEALRNDEQGVVGFRLAVTPQGGVGGCTIIASSGSQSLDATTCRIMTERARFTPARDRRGRPTADAVNGRIRWQIQDDDVMLAIDPPREGWTSLQRIFTSADYPQEARTQRAQGVVDVRLTIATTGSVSGCQVVASSGNVALDRQTCAVASSRVHILPPLDAAGNVVAGTLNATVHWRLPAA